ncbi:TolC family protein [Aquimarina pacifica]|uniref:TolC family protein n=1 Tax=Aquimarina pacifica TaxID=1296415 RepID=UPI000471B6AB|nr:TolC family protein [Aquimarina pacifica]
MKTLIIYVFALFAFTKTGWTQNIEGSQNQILSFEEYLGFVKTHHPLMKQANLILSTGEARLLKSRGGFDPKIEVDYDRKKFKETEYFDQLNATFKIPTWYGIEFKANFEENTGEFLNPSATVPDDGLYSAGISFSLAQGFLINERMASLKKARFFREQTKADRDLLVNTILFEASKAYFDWLEATNEQLIYESFLENATTRLKAVERSVDLGEKAAIDITESRITLQTRQLNLEAAKLKRQKAALIVSTYLWLNDIPMEIQENVVPVLPELVTLETSLLLDDISNRAAALENHPKILSLEAKIDQLTIDRSLKLNKLLPKIDLQYNFLSPEYNDINTFNTANYKAFVNVSFPLFLRKERGDLKLASIKIQDANFERVSASLNIQNKIDAVNAEIQSIATQNELINNIVKDYVAMVQAEERKFFMGESSLFLINSREQKLIDARLKENALLIKQRIATASLYNALGISEPILN